MEELINGMVIITFIILSILLGYAVYDEFTAKTFSLRKNEWHCSKNKETTMVEYNVALKMPTVNTITECIQWEAN